MTIVLPPLNCLWNDVLHLSLMHPALIYRTLSEMGFEHHRKPRAWFVVEAELRRAARMRSTHFSTRIEGNNSGTGIALSGGE